MTDKRYSLAQIMNECEEFFSSDTVRKYNKSLFFRFFLWKKKKESLKRNNLNSIAFYYQQFKMN